MTDPRHADPPQRAGSGADPSGADPIAADREIDITRELCPMTMVRTRLALDRMAPGEVLAVRLRGEEPIENVPRAAAALGHTVLGMHSGPDGTQRLLLRRG